MKVSKVGDLVKWSPAITAPEMDAHIGIIMERLNFKREDEQITYQVYWFKPNNWNVCSHENIVRASKNEEEV